MNRSQHDRIVQSLLAVARPVRNSTGKRNHMKNTARRMKRPLGFTVGLVAFLCALGTTTPSTLGDVAPAIAAGGDHTLGLKTNSTVWACGLNEYGQLGNGTTNDSVAPIQVSAISGILAIAAGQEHSVGLKTNGLVWAWGFNNHGQLGNGTTNNTDVPVQVSAITDVRAIAAGQYHTVALKTNGTVWSWGWDNYKQLGTGCTGNFTNVPIQVNGIANITIIAAGGNHTVALKLDGTAWVWGDNSQGELGIGKTGGSTNLPVQIHGLTNVKGIAAGYNQTHVLKTDGTVWGCGYNQYGELGNNTSKSTNLPVQASITGVTAIAAGHSHTLALKADGTVWAWGFGNYGALGNGTVGTSLVPTQTVNLTNVIAIAAGEYFSLALKADGTVWGWGANGKGNLGLSSAIGQTNLPVQIDSLNLGTIAPIVITTPSPLLTGTVSTAYSQNLTVTGGTWPYTWSVLSGSLPTGLGLVGSSGAITGTPTVATTANFTVQVADNNGATTNKAFSVTINAAPVTLTITTPSPLPAGTVGTAYNQTFQAAGGTPTYSWSFVSGSLPFGLGLVASSGAITGTPTAATTANFRVRVTDSVSATAEKDFSLTVSQGGATCASATRVLPTCGYLTGVVNTVTVTITPCSNTLNYAVEDVPPVGWTASGIDNGGSWDSATHKVKWGPFLDNTARTLTYQVTPLAGQTGVVQFAGTASFDGVGQATGGSSSIDKCTALPHPADLDMNFSMVINEVTAYGAAWKTGATWPVAPNPIPIDYLTRAGYLWKQGEVYHYDALATPPLCWTLGTGVLASPPARASARRIAATAAGAAVRTLPSFYTPQVAVSVTIAVTPHPSVSSYAVEDAPPAGWTVSGIDNGGSWDSVNGKVKWPFFDNTPRTLGYQATPPVGTTGDKTFAGSASFDGVHTAIGGPGTISHVKLPPSIVTLPTITNQLMVINGLNLVPGGEPVTFTVGVTDPNGGLAWTCLWDFGDGMTSTDCDSTHIFTNCGPHVVTITVDNGFSVPASTNVLMQVPCQLTVTKLQALVNFAKLSNDTSSVTATLDLGEFTPTNQTRVVVDIGGAQRSFTLDSKGRGVATILDGKGRKVSIGLCRLTYTKPKLRPARTGFWTLSATLSKGTWRDPWHASGLVNDTIAAKANDLVTLPVTVVIGDESFANDTYPLKYTATKNKNGTAK